MLGDDKEVAELSHTAAFAEVSKGTLREEPRNMRHEGVGKMHAWREIGGHLPRYRMLPELRRVLVASHEQSPQA
jgi:hypothetical protein